MRAIAEIGRAAWPEIPVTAEAFSEELEARGIADLDPERAADVYLAWACASGDHAALAAFEASHGAAFTGFAAGVRLDGDVLSDVLQEIRERLFVGRAGRGPLIAQYTGRGELRAWLRVIVVREALHAARRRRRHRDADAPLEQLAAPTIDLDAALTRARCGDAFRAALAEALAALEPRERGMLRYRYVDQLTDEEIGRIYQAHRVSVTRWIARARVRLLSLTRRGLRERLGLAPEELSTVIRAVRSQLGSSLSGVLRK